MQLKQNEAKDQSELDSLDGKVRRRFDSSDRETLVLCDAMKDYPRRSVRSRDSGARPNIGLRFICFILLISYGIFFSWGKSPVISDAIAQTMGAILGLYLIFLISRRCSKNKNTPYIIVIFVTLFAFCGQVYVRNQLKIEHTNKSSLDNTRAENSELLNDNKTRRSETNGEISQIKNTSNGNQANSGAVAQMKSLQNIDKMYETIHSDGIFRVVHLIPRYTDEEIKILVDNYIIKYKNEPIHPNEMTAYAEITKACRSDLSITINRRNCFNENYELIDRSLNHNYQLVMKSITKQEREKLRNFQREWIKDRKRYSAQYQSHNYGGTLSPEDVSESYRRWTFDRSVQLYELFNIIKYHKSNGEAYPVVFE